MAQIVPYALGGADYNVEIVFDVETRLFQAQCIEVPGAISLGRTQEEILENMAEAIEMVLAAEAETETC